VSGIEVRTCLFPVLQGDTQSGGAAPTLSTVGFPDSTVRERRDRCAPSECGPGVPDQTTLSHLVPLQEHFRGWRAMEITYRSVEKYTEARLKAIEMCVSNRHSGHRNADSSDAVIKDRRSAGRFRAFLVIRHSAAMSSSRLSERPLASVALKWVQTNSSGFRSGA
jgi:hypothetical protein